MSDKKYFFDAPQDVHPERLWTTRYIGNPKGKVILDMGCGTHKTIPEAMGVDIRPGVTDYVGGMDYLPFIPSYSADFIISRHSLEHILDPVNTLREWKRLLFPDGRILIILPDHGAIDTMDNFYSGGTHLHAYTKGSFENLINGLELFRFIVYPQTVIPNWSFGSVLENY